MQSSSQPWPPQSEPVTPAAVVARLDDLGYSPAGYRLAGHGKRHALIVTAKVVAIIDLVDGHEVSTYSDERGGMAALLAITKGDLL